MSRWSVLMNAHFMWWIYIKYFPDNRIVPFANQWIQLHLMYILVDDLSQVTSIAYIFLSLCIPWESTLQHGLYTALMQLTT